MEHEVEERAQAEGGEEGREASIEVGDDGKLEALRAEQAERLRHLGEDPPRLSAAVVGEQLREARLERRPFRGGPECPAHDRVPPRALALGETGAADTGEGERGGGDERLAEVPLGPSGRERDSVPSREAGVGPPDRLGHREERADRVERDRLETHQGRRGPPNSGSSQNWISTPCAWRGWMTAVRRPPGISALPISSMPSASRRRTSGSSRSTSIVR